MLNSIEIRNVCLDELGSGCGSSRVRGCGMAGLAERYWEELRPSAAGRYQLDVANRYVRDKTGRGLRRPRRLKLKLRPATR
jgi:hypothetical protein